MILTHAESFLLRLKTLPSSRRNGGGKHDRSERRYRAPRAEEMGGWATLSFVGCVLVEPGPNVVFGLEGAIGIE